MDADNGGLKGQQLMQAVDQQTWDPSVKGLTQFSDVFQQMATNLSWTSSLGDAYFNAPQNVMNAVQVMRQGLRGGQSEIDSPAERSGRESACGAEPAAPASSGAAAGDGCAVSAADDRDSAGAARRCLCAQLPRPQFTAPRSPRRQVIPLKPW